MEVLRCIPGYDSFVLEALEVLRHENEVIDIDRSTVARFIEKEENYFFVAADNGEVVGSATVIRLRRPFSKADAGMLTDIRVLSSREGQGVDRLLLEAVKGACSRDGMEVLTATADSDGAKALMRQSGGIMSGREDAAQFVFIL